MKTTGNKAYLLCVALCFCLAGWANGQLRINEVGYNGVDVQGAARWVEIYNAGDAAVDVSGYWLCNFPAYAQINSLTVLAGDVSIPAGGYLVVAYDDVGDGSGEMGLYSGGNFGSAADMVDYMQYGSSGHQREPVAVQAGLWEAGAFVEAAAEGKSLSFFANGGAAAANWASTDASAGGENIENTGTPVDREAHLPGSFTLLGHYPEPFNPSTTVLFNLQEASTIQVLVYDLLGREVMATPEQRFSAGENLAISLDAGALSSGAYFYRVLARGARSSAIQAGRMTLVK